VFEGEVYLLDAAGLCVISDIDDTIKISEVRDRDALLRNTFLRPYRAVEGMAEVYAEWAQRPAVSFHYVSASPWQLFRPLRDFLKDAGFPEGPMELKHFRWTDSSFFNLFASPEEYKPAVIAPLLERLPGRRFVLVGDSGEKDPEIYAALARRYPAQVVRILIRDVTGEGPNAERFGTVFVGLPPDLWRIFRDPAGVIAAIPPP
jgi:phosphatidate phosphatase APP1